MPTHWTYSDFNPGDDLFQGDIIARDPLLGILRQVHAHFLDPKYLAFIVVTQTCDMVMRGDQCRTRHVSLAVVRSLASLMPDLLTEMCESPHPNVFTSESKFAADQFLRRVLNQNEQAHGMVYLHSDGDVGIGEPAVALLRVSISLRAKEHYELIRKARQGRLGTEYRNKLGWLAGNLYSRVDTPDWSDHTNGEDEERRIIDDLLLGTTGDSRNVWVPTAWVQAAKSKKVDLKSVSTENIVDVLREHAPPPPLEIARTEITSVSTKLLADFGGNPVESFKTKLPADQCLMPTLRPGLLAVLQAALDASHSDISASADAATTDETLRGHVVARLQERATTFLGAKGPKALPTFLSQVQASPILTTAAVERIELIAEERLGGAYRARRGQVRTALLALTPDGVFTAHVRSMALEAIQETFTPTLLNRLQNSAPFKSSIRPQ